VISKIIIIYLLITIYSTPDSSSHTNLFHPSAAVWDPSLAAGLTLGVGEVVLDAGYAVRTKVEVPAVDFEQVDRVEEVEGCLCFDHGVGQEAG